MVSPGRIALLSPAPRIAEEKTEDSATKENVSASTVSLVPAAISKPVLTPAQTTENASKESVSVNLASKASTALFQYAPTTAQKEESALGRLPIDAPVIKTIQVSTAHKRSALIIAQEKDHVTIF
jgi:hypothetical protein